MEKAEKYDKILNEMRELLKEKEMLEEIKNQKKLLEEKEKLKEIKERELLKRLKIKAEKIYFEKAEFDIPYFIRNVEYEDITTLREKGFIDNYENKRRKYVITDIGYKVIELINKNR